MEWAPLIYAVIYFVIGSFLSDQCGDDDIIKMLVFITWPIIIGVLVICSAALLLIGLVYMILEFIQWFIQIVTGGDNNGVVQ